MVGIVGIAGTAGAAAGIRASDFAGFSAAEPLAGLFSAVAAMPAPISKVAVNPAAAICFNMLTVISKI
jgi:hypothetical protein